MQARNDLTAWAGLLAATMIFGCESGPPPGPGPQGTQAATAEPAGAAEAVQKLGARLVLSEQTAVADLMRDPKAYEGKTVRVSGEVEDFCHHRRTWFAVSAPDGKGMVRVFAAPKFRAPADCKGKTAVAEGTVEVREIPAEQIEHFGKEHKFLQGVEIEEGKPVLRPVIRALGAEFR
ncbi:MAG: DUF4920 domain-containing protein [Deltaproteobacteria bacterium]|jgi:hypothetical protein|nr:DUF4920 domain-containing protein [Deltaproteobacteria bacterium]MBW2532126.1 DUF4920 domain-containing protein [Deltaproteobacteria bacterium]